MTELFEPHATLYSLGIAVGWSDIKNDSLVFEFRRERFEFPTIEAFPIAEWNGYFYTAPIIKLRALVEKKKNGKAKEEKESASA